MSKSNLLFEILEQAGLSLSPKSGAQQKSMKLKVLLLEWENVCENNFSCLNTRIEGNRDVRFSVFEAESLEWPRSVELGKVLTNSEHVISIYKVSDKNVQERKISTCIMLSIFTKAGVHVPLKILSIEDGTVLKTSNHLNNKVYFIERFNEKLYVKQNRNSELKEVAMTKPDSDDLLPEDNGCLEEELNWDTSLALIREKIWRRTLLIPKSDMGVGIAVEAIESGAVLPARVFEQIECQIAQVKEEAYDGVLLLSMFENCCVLRQQKILSAIGGRGQKKHQGQIKKMQ